MLSGQPFAIKLSTNMTPHWSAKSPSTKLLPWLATWLLVWALLLSQTLGLVHGVVHGLTGDAAYAALSKSSVQSNTVMQSAGKGGLASLFSSHTSHADCRLYDQASHGSVLPSVAALALPVLLPSSVVAIFQGESLARWAALFEARGPPLTR